MNPEKIAGRYRILTALGSGGMGMVYKALDERFGRVVVLKVLRREKHFLPEAMLLQRLNHPNIVQVYDVGEAEGLSYVAMEYIEGSPLAQVVSEGKPLDLDYAIEIIRQVGSALSAAHQQGLVHRDLKPSNILVSKDGRVLLSDFGLVIAFGEPTLTDIGTIKGTPAYMSPEQAMGKPLDARSDIYSLGIVLYELLTGHRLLFDESVSEQLRKTVEELPPPSQQFNPAIPDGVDQVILKALAKDPDQRYQTVSEFITALVTANEKRASRELQRPQKTEELPDASPGQAENDEACHQIASVSGALKPKHEQPRLPEELPQPLEGIKIEDLLEKAGQQMQRGDIGAVLRTVEEILRFEPGASEALKLQRDASNILERALLAEACSKVATEGLKLEPSHAEFLEKVRKVKEVLKLKGTLKLQLEEPQTRQVGKAQDTASKNVLADEPSLKLPLKPGSSQTSLPSPKLSKKRSSSVILIFCIVLLLVVVLVGLLPVVVYRRLSGEGPSRLNKPERSGQPSQYILILLTAVGGGMGFWLLYRSNLIKNKRPAPVKREVLPPPSPSDRLKAGSRVVTKEIGPSAVAQAGAALSESETQQRLIFEDQSPTGTTIPYRPPPVATTEILKREPSAMAWLLVVNGPLRGRQLRLADSIAIGRGSDCSVILPDPTVSRHHAKMRLENSRFYIYDSESTAGVFVNGIRVHKQELRDRDEIRIGDTILLFIQAVSPEDLHVEAKRRVREFDSVWEQLTESVRHG